MSNPVTSHRRKASASGTLETGRGHTVDRSTE
jgi:hypothetical protein